MCRRAAVIHLSVFQFAFREVGRNVLIQRASHGDIDDLQSATDAENRQLVLNGFLDEEKFENVTRIVHLSQELMALRTVISRVNVGTARHEHTVEMRQNLFYKGGVVRGGNQIGNASCHLDRLRTVIADGKAVALQCRRNADYGFLGFLDRFSQVGFVVERLNKTVPFLTCALAANVQRQTNAINRILFISLNKIFCKYKEKKCIVTAFFLILS